MITLPVDILEEKAALVEGSELGSALVNCVGLDDFERILWLVGQHSPGSLQIAKDGDHVLGVEIGATDGLRTCIEFLRKGYSVALNHAENWDPSLAKLVREVGRSFGCLASSSIFFTPPNSATFPAHYDAIDVIAVQLVGCKLWRIGSNETDLPTVNATLSIDQEVEWETDYTLRPSDALYVPRGKIHEVRAGSEEPSLHISIGLAHRTHADVLVRAIEITNETRIAYRRSNIKNQNAAAASSFDVGDTDLPEVNPYSMGIFKQGIYAADLASLPMLPNQFHNAIQPAEHKTSTIYSRTDYCEITREYLGKGKVGIGFPGLAKGRINTSTPFLMFPVSALPVLEAIRNRTDNFTAACLPGSLSNESKLTILSRLHREGLLRMVK